MHPIVRICLSLVTAATIVWAIAATSGDAAAQSLSLPDVSVTAPANTPPPPPSVNAYFGKVRVEEENWPEVPCGASQIGAAADATCRRGPRQETFQVGDAQGSRQQSNCNIAHDLVISTLGALAFEADALVFDPYYVSALGHQRQDCYVHAATEDLRAVFPDMNQMTRRGNGWGNFQDAAGDIATMQFSSGGDSCLAFEKRGPRWGGGYVYLIHASVCRKDRRPIDAADLNSVIALLLVKRGDAQGNLNR